MKKFFALVLVLCMMAAALPAPAESAGSGLPGLLSGLLSSENGIEGELSSLLNLLSGLKTRFQGNKALFSMILSVLKPKLESLLGAGGSSLGSIVSGLTEKLTGSGDLNLEGLLGGLLGSDSGSGGDEEYTLSEEELAELEREKEERNQFVLADTGESLSTKKDAESLEEFYGNWIYDRIVSPENEYDLSDCGIGIVLGENTFYYTMDGELASDSGLPPEVQEMKLDYGMLKIKISDQWYEYALTQDNELVELHEDSLSYYTPAAQ